MRVLLRRLRHVHRRQGRACRQRARESGSPGQPRAALSRRGCPSTTPSTRSTARSIRSCARATASRASAGTTRSRRWPRGFARYRSGTAPARWASSARDSSSPRSSTRSASSCSSGLGTPQLRRQHDALHVHRRGRLQALVRQRRSAWGVRGPRARRRHPAHRRQHRGEPPDPVLAAQSNPGTTLIAVDPRVTKTAMMADLHLPIQPRSDLALSERPDSRRHRAQPRRSRVRRSRTRPASRRCANRFATTRPSAWPRSPASRAELILRTAWTYAHARAGFIGWTMGVNHSTKGTETVNAINNLALITGNIGRAGAAPFSITGQCNAMGTREAGFASMHARLPEVRERGGSRGARRALGRAGRSDPDRRAASRIPTSSRRRSSAASARSGSSPPIRSCRSRISARSSRRSRGSTSSSCRTDITRRPPRSTPHLCSRPRCGARRRAPTRTPSGASAR